MGNDTPHTHIQTPMQDLTHYPKSSFQGESRSKLFGYKGSASTQSTLGEDYWNISVHPVNLSVSFLLGCGISASLCS